jgi:hypothetical protein
MKNISKTWWTFQTRDAVDASGLHRGSPTDARGLRLRLESGYGWVNRNDGSGWLQLEVAIRRAEIAETTGSVTGYNLGTMLDANGRSEARVDKMRRRRR